MFKRAIITLALAAAMAATASAQGIVPVREPEPEPDIVLKPFVLSIGPKVGANYSIASDPDDLNLGMGGNVGFLAGAAAEIRFGRPAGRPLGTERFGVRLEAMYSLRSLKTDVEDISLNCFEVPVLFEWYFLPNFALELGPTFTGALSTSPKELKFNDAVYRMDKVKAYDVMLSVGINCKLKNGFTADLRYNMANSDMAGNFRTKVSTISLGLGWLFNVIK